MPVSRRRFLLATVLPMLTVGVTGALAVASGQQTAAEVVPGPDPSAVVPASITAGSVVQIVAHPDDDLYFMNPDISRSLTAGTPLTTLYLTSGEADGRNGAVGGAAKDPAQPVDRRHYAEARQNGIRAAYAQMATGDRTSAWRRTVISTAGGGHAELDVLVAKPHINLVWMQIREARASTTDTVDNLRGLWNGRTPTVSPYLAAETPVTQPPRYTKDQVIAAISGLLERYKPTTIRMLDPTPGRYQDTGKVTDHQDHTFSARFAQAGAASYAARVPLGQRPRFTVQNYLGYHNGRLPHTLDPQTVQKKVGFLKTYAWSDKQNYCGSPSGCGDRKVAGNPAGHNWAESLRYVRGDYSSWLAQGTTGHLYAFAVLDGQMAVWNRGAGTGAGAAWQGPALLPGTGIDPGATTVRLPDGRVVVLATRTVFGDRPEDYRREIVYGAQSVPGGPFMAWVSLGTPEPGDESGISSISAPTAAVDQDGRLTVYVRNSRRVLLARTQDRPSGAFGGWQQLGGGDLQSDPVTATDSAGRRHVYVATTQSVLAWIQPAPGAPLAGPFPTGLPATTLPLTAAPEAAGIRLYFRRPDSGAVRTALVTAAAGGALPVVSSITETGGRAGYGAVGVAGRVIVGRTGSGTISTTSIGGPSAWTESEVLYAGAPAGIQEPGGKTTTAVLGLDAELHVTTTLATSTRTTWHRAVPTA
ncbi:PIG-L family deacetylase [Streptomyces sp. H34-S4]|uniref:PIG-L family deacetylase n=1 Tax=Streptomyces sp. H34-S4 TaxID=2996463 RepID=UPI00226E9E42|nr:PIG-L family deacetylase [Streptomyces sp. H34-S4]MCY0937306.1 PIG-L family deacetylase [Streptomyces sp. H34-S4]